LVDHHCRDITRNEANCVAQRGPTVLAYGPFYKNGVTCGPRRQNDV